MGLGQSTRWNSHTQHSQARFLSPFFSTAKPRRSFTLHPRAPVHPAAVARRHCPTCFALLGPGSRLCAFFRWFPPSPRPFLMPIATSPSVPRLATFAKMEDRKRPASTAVDDNAPPSKRQAVNGASKPKDDADKDKEELWIEVSPDCRASRPSASLLPASRFHFPPHTASRRRARPSTRPSLASAARCSMQARVPQSTSAAVSAGVPALTSLLMRGSLGTASPKTRPASPSPALTLLPITYLVATFPPRCTHVISWVVGMGTRLTRTGSCRNIKRAPSTARCKSTSGSDHDSKSGYKRSYKSRPIMTTTFDGSMLGCCRYVGHFKTWPGSC